jgi:hypothetical protein
MVMQSVMARKMWRTLEPIHGMIYFAPEAAEAYKVLGIDDFRMGYFASRSAPMGAVAADVVIATFFNFNPLVVRGAIPAAWAIASPSQIVAARFTAAAGALSRTIGAVPEEAADLARRAASDLDPAGRPLFAGHASLDWRLGVVACALPAPRIPRRRPHRGDGRRGRDRHRSVGVARSVG